MKIKRKKRYLGKRILGGECEPLDENDPSHPVKNGWPYKGRMRSFEDCSHVTPH